jgi:hypothetical protein
MGNAILKRKYLVLIAAGFVGALLGGSLYYSFVLAQSAGDYDPWNDINDDGTIDMRDIGAVARKFGNNGVPFETKAGWAYDSGWINITDKRGQYFNITHNLNLTSSYMPRFYGKVRNDGPLHLKYWYGFGQPGWNQTYGGELFEEGQSLIKTGDGGYAITGTTQSFGAGGGDFWLVKTDAMGNHQWNQTYGGTDWEYGFSLVETSDGGYAITGNTQSFGEGARDFWLVKTDAMGNHQWNQTYGGELTDFGVSLVETSDGGYAITGFTNSFSVGGTDFWLVKTDAMGNHQWNQTYGGTSGDVGFSLVETSDGGYTITGYTWSFGAGQSDVWLVKTDASGNHQWNQTYGGTSQDEGRGLVETGDGGYAIIGRTDSFGVGGTNVWLVKTDAMGNSEWDNTCGGIDGDVGYSLVETSDGGYTITGTTYSFGAGGSDVWLVKTDALGMTDLEWGLTVTDSTADELILYRGRTDPYWNFVRVVIWVVKDTP